MGCQELGRPPLSPRRLALEAVEARLQALHEYLTVYRAGARGRGRRRERLRELRRDIDRLESWGWYLRAAQGRPLWWRLLTWVAALLGGRRRGRPGQRQPRRRHGIQRLSAFSVIDRAYVALAEEYQGRLLTLGLTPGGGAARRQHCHRKVAALEALRAGLAGDAGRVAVICGVLGLVRRCGGLVGLNPAPARTVDS